MKEEDLVKFNFALPYIFLPRAQTEPQHDTIVNVVTEVNGKGATFEFDWEMDELDVRTMIRLHSPMRAFSYTLFNLQEIAESVLRDNDLDPEKDTDALEQLKQTIRTSVEAEKKRIKEEKAAWRENINSLSPEEKKALDELKILKFYPQNEYPDLSACKVPSSLSATRSLAC